VALREREKITLIGRRTELDGILALLDSGPQHIPLIAIGGPGGIGKSALASEVGRVARSKGYQVAVARCRDGSPYPYAAFRDLIEGLNDPVTSVNPFRDENAKSSKDGILIAFESFLSGRSRTDPLLIVLEDLQHADSSTLRLLSYLIRSIKEGGVRFVCTFCQEEAVVAEPGLSIFNEFVSRAVQDAVCRTLVLSGLQPDEIAKLISGRFQLNLPKNAVDKVSKTCHGNPLLAIESIRSIDSAGSMELRDGVLRCDRLGPLPMTFEEAVKNRLGGLNDLQLKLLFHASTFEKNRDLNDLAEALEAGPDDVASIIEELHRKSDLIDRIGNEYLFPHERVRRAIRDLISPQDRKATHGSVAKALGGNEYPEECLGELSMHWLQAEDRDKCINFSVRTGRTCAACGAHLESVLYFGRALRLVEGTEQRDVLLESCESMGDAYLGLGRKDLAMELYGKALKHSASSDRARLLRKKSNCVRSMSSDKENEASLSLILQALIEAGDEYETAECKSGIATALVVNGDVEGAEKLCLAAMKVFKDRGMVDRLAEEMMQYGEILLKIGKVDQGIDTLTQAVRMVNEHPNLEKELDGAEALAMAYLNKGDEEMANMLLEHCLDISWHTGDRKRAETIQGHKTFASDLAKDISKVVGNP
jgi:predicted ATPase